MNAPSLRLLAGIILYLGMVSVLFFSYKTSAGAHVFDVFIAWALVPYLVALLATLFPQGRSGALGVLLGCLLLVVGSAGAYYDAFFVHSDAQGGLVFVFFPPWQLVYSLALVGCACAASVRFAHGKPTRAA